MQHKAVYLIFGKFTLHVSGFNHTASSGVHKAVTTASGTVQLPPSNVTKPCVASLWAIISIDQRRTEP